MNILLFGAPGAGKGTQSAILVENYDMKHISTGDLFRYNIKNETSLGKEAKSYIDKGELVPDSVTIGMVDSELKGLHKSGFILDGFPRNVSQAEALSSLLSEASVSLDKAIFLEVPKEEIVGRLSGRRLCKGCGAVYHVKTMPTKDGCKTCDKCEGEIYQRPDDQEDAIRKRLEVYEESTRPLKDFYSKTGVLVEINGTGSTDEIFGRLKEVLDT